MAGLLSVKAAETLPSLTQDYSITVLDEEAGLSYFALASLAQTPDGWLWFSTFWTLGRFDGTRFEDLGAESSPVLTNASPRTLLVDRRGRLWVGAEGRILCQETNGWRLFGTQEGVPAGLFGSLTEDAPGRIWAASGTNIIRLAGDRFEAVPLPEERHEAAFGLATDRSGTVWCSSTIYLGRFEAGRWVTVFNAAQTLTNQIMGMLPARPEGLWVGFQHDIKLWRNGGWAKVWPRPEGFRDDALRLLEDSRGNLWAGGWRSGVVVFGADGQVRQATTREGLASNAIADLLEDCEGNIWLASNGGGLVRLRPRAFRAYGTEAGLAQVANCVAEEAPGRMLVGTHGDGLAKWEAGRVSSHELWVETNRPESTYILSVLKARNGDLWVGTYLAGLNRLFAGGWEGIPSAQIGANTVRSLFEDRDGRLWVGSNTGLAVRERGEFRVCGPETGLPKTAVCGIGQDGAGSLWVYAFGAGLFRQQAGRFARFQVPGLATNTSYMALLGTRDGSLWVGTKQRALCRVQGETVFVYGERHGLPPVDICGILEDDAGDLWLACLEGVVRLGRQSLDLVARQPQARLECQVFDKRDGLAGQVRMTLQPVCCKASDGRLWFATARGLAVVDPRRIPPHLPPPTVVIDELLVDHKPYSGWNEPGKRLRLPPSIHHVDFHYSVARLGVPERIRFQRRLHPNNAWEDANQARVSQYEDLPPGRYQFAVRATDNDGQWGAPAALAFEVQPSYWQTAWFRLAVLLIVGGLAWSAHHWRVTGLERRRQAQTDFSRRLIESQEEERKRIAAELHDGLGQHLLVIKNMAALGVRSAPDDPARTEKFTAISSLASLVIGEIRQMSRALRPVELDRLGLTKALTWLIKPAGDSSNIRFDAEVDELDGLFPPEFEINLYRIVQECLANILKHSQATTARVQIKREPPHVRVTIQDNGRGFVPTPAGVPTVGGMGLTDMAERVRIMSGQLAVESAPAAGTSVRILIPLPGPGRASKTQTGTI